MADYKRANKYNFLNLNFGGRRLNGDVLITSPGPQTQKFKKRLLVCYEEIPPRSDSSQLPINPQSWHYKK